MGRRVHFEVVTQGNAEELAKFYADTFERDVLTRTTHSTTDQLRNRDR
jgi:uncharacterized glyoxalase superfamily protein PhnB